MSKNVTRYIRYIADAFCHFRQKRALFREKDMSLAMELLRLNQCNCFVTVTLSFYIPISLDKPLNNIKVPYRYRL